MGPSVSTSLGPMGFQRLMTGAVASVEVMLTGPNVCKDAEVYVAMCLQRQAIPVIGSLASPM